MDKTKVLRKLMAFVLAAGTLASNIQMPVVTAEESSVGNSTIGTIVPDNAIAVDVHGTGKVVVEQNGEEKEISSLTMFYGEYGDQITVKASETFLPMTGFAVFQNGNYLNANPECESESSYTATIGTDRYINLVFKEVNYDNQISEAYTANDINSLPASGGGSLWAISTTDVYGDRFNLQWIDGPLAPFKDIIAQVEGECTDYGWLAWTDDNPYGISSLSYTYTATRVGNVVKVNITVPKNTDCTGFSDLGIVGYQGIAWHDISIEIPTKTIHIDLNKISANPVITEGNECYSLGNAEYRAYLDAACTNQIGGSIITNTLGKASIDISNVPNEVNTIFVKEYKASKGFALDTTIYTVDLVSNRGTVTSIEQPGNDPLTITLTKKPTNGHYSSNIPSLAGAEFTLKYYAVDPETHATVESVKDLTPAKTWVLGTKKTASGKYIAILANSYKVSGDDLYLENGHAVIPLGVITIEETKAPNGYTLENSFLNEVNNQTVTQTNGIAYFAVKQDGEGLFQVQGGNEYTVEDDEYSAKAKIHKITNINISGSSYSEPEEGAFFALVKKDYVQQQGTVSYNNVLKAVAAQFDTTVDNITDREWLDTNYQSYTFDGTQTGKMTDHEFAIMRTDSEGNAITGDLVLDTYELVQLASPSDEISISKDVREYTFTYDGEVKQFEASNVAELYNIKIVKKDADTAKTISFNSADFKIYQIKDGNKEYVTQKVGSKKYSTFRTTSQNGKGQTNVYYAADEEGGTVTLPLELRAGTYYIEELNTPYGYLKGQDLKFEVKKSKITETDEDGNNYVTVVFEDKPVSGEVKVAKKIEDVVADTNLLGDSLTKVEFTLKADEDIVDPSTGDIVIHKGETAKDHDGEVVGVFNPDESGNATVKNLYLGKYTLVESYIPGCFLDTDFSQKVEIKQTDDVTMPIRVGYTVTNKETEMEISKKSVTGQGELTGATLQVLDKNGNLVDEWISTNETHKIAGLNRGETYTLIETITPDDGDYAKATPIQFTVKEDGKTDTVEMVNKVVTVSKIDMNGEEVTGASMSVTNESGDVIDQWISAGTEHKIKNLEEGKSYVLHEDLAPTGYVKATDIPFTVDGADEDGFKVDQHIDMTDKKVTINKTDGNGNEVENAKIIITDENGEVVDQWTSDGTIHDVENLEVAKTYTWHEEYNEDIFGYYYAEDYTFTVTDDGIDQNLEMVDSPIKYQIIKVDENGDNVKGVTLTLTDITDENNPKEIELPNNGVTTGEPFDIGTLVQANKTYKLVESEYINGLYKATDMTFSVPLHGTSEVTKITMEDDFTNVAVNKVDNYGNPVVGATLQVFEAVPVEEATRPDPEQTVDPDFGAEDEPIGLAEGSYEDTQATRPEGDIDPDFGQDEDPTVNVDRYTTINGVTYYLGNPVCEFTTDGSYKDISSYVKGSNEASGDVMYVLRESKTPFGYKTMNDIAFKVTGTTDQKQIITGIDERQHYFVSAVKVDAQDHSKKLKGAEITLFRPDGTVAKDVNGKECKGLTDGKGNIVWEVEYNDNMENGGYYVQETAAPQGYRINSNKYNVTLSEDYDFASNNPVVIVVNDEALPSSNVQTGIHTGMLMFGGLFALASAAVFLLIKLRKGCN